MHGNTKRLPHNRLTDAVITNVTKILKSYAEGNAILLPGRIPGHNRDDIKLLPSSRSKKVPPGISKNKHCLITCQLWCYCYYTHCLSRTLNKKIQTQITHVQQTFNI